MYKNNSKLKIVRSRFPARISGMGFSDPNSWWQFKSACPLFSI